MLIQGNCFQEYSRIPANSVDFICIDPPYGISGFKWDKNFKEKEFWHLISYSLKPNGVVAIFGIEPFASRIRNQNKQWYRYDWYWLKDNPTNHCNCYRSPLRKMENIMIFSPATIGNHTYNPQGLIEVNKKTSMPETRGGKAYSLKGAKRTRHIQKHTNFPTNLLSLKKEKSPFTFAKPVKLLDYLIKTYTDPKETVLDFCMGSGSCGVAAKKANRKFIGIEQDKETFELAKKNIDNG